MQARMSHMSAVDSFATCCMAHGLHGVLQAGAIHCASCCVDIRSVICVSCCAEAPVECTRAGTRVLLWVQACSTNASVCFRLDAVCQEGLTCITDPPAALILANTAVPSPSRAALLFLLCPMSCPPDDPDPRSSSLSLRLTIMTYIELYYAMN
jgi:hypothetical protein